MNAISDQQDSLESDSTISGHENHDDLDPLTGLLTRPALRRAISGFMSDPVKEYCMIATDITNFHFFNKWYGWDRGNQLLQSVAEFLKSKGDSILTGLIHSDDQDNFLHWTDLSQIADRVHSGDKYIRHVLRARLPGEYQWISFEITVPADYTETSPWILFTWKEAENTIRYSQEAMNIINRLYRKVVRVDLANDSFEIFKLRSSDCSLFPGISDKWTTWLRNIMEAGRIHPEDQSRFSEFWNLDVIRQHFQHSGEKLCIRYRHQFGDNNYRQVCMKLIRGIDYTDVIPYVIVYFSDEE